MAYCGTIANSCHPHDCYGFLVCYMLQNPIPDLFPVVNHGLPTFFLGDQDLGLGIRDAYGRGPKRREEKRKKKKYSGINMRDKGGRVFSDL